LIRTIKNPISLARLVMEKTSHVLLAGEGAEQFAASAGVELCDNSYFYTENRYSRLISWSSSFLLPLTGLSVR
jgi:beta-aspartyl-peptidase (threonine type)